MNIACTRKLLSATKREAKVLDVATDPLFSWIANWTNTFADEAEDLLVLVNLETKFTVTIYGFTSEHFADMESKIQLAIRHSFQLMGINPDIIDHYMDLAGDIQFTANKDRSHAAWVTHHGDRAAFYISDVVSDCDSIITYADDLGFIVNRDIAKHSKTKTGFVPRLAMQVCLMHLSAMTLFRYRA